MDEVFDLARACDTSLDNNVVTIRHPQAIPALQAALKERNAPVLAQRAFEGDGWIIHAIAMRVDDLRFLEAGCENVIDLVCHTARIRTLAKAKDLDELRMALAEFGLESLANAIDEDKNWVHAIEKCEPLAMIEERCQSLTFQKRSVELE